MIYNLTPEQVKKNKTVNWYVMGILLLILIVMLVFLSWPSLSKGTQEFPKLMALWSITLVLTDLGAMVGMNSARKKRITQLEVKPDTLVLISDNGPEEIKYSSVKKLNIHSDLQGQLKTIFLKLAQRPPLFLVGYEDMDRLARDLENKVSDPDLVARTEGNPTPQKRLAGILMLVGILAGIFGFMFLLFKMGFGFLFIPFSIILSGISRFSMGRADRKKRLTGILIIFGGIVWAVIEFLLLAHGAKG